MVGWLSRQVALNTHTLCGNGRALSGISTASFSLFLALVVDINKQRVHNRINGGKYCISSGSDGQRVHNRINGGKYCISSGSDGQRVHNRINGGKYCISSGSDRQRVHHRMNGGKYHQHNKYHTSLRSEFLQGLLLQQCYMAG